MISLNKKPIKKEEEIDHEIENESKKIETYGIISEKTFGDLKLFEYFCSKFG